MTIFQRQKPRYRWSVYTPSHLLPQSCSLHAEQTKIRFTLRFTCVVLCTFLVAFNLITRLRWRHLATRNTHTHEHASVGTCMLQYDSIREQHFGFCILYTCSYICSTIGTVVCASVSANQGTSHQRLQGALCFMRMRVYTHDDRDVLTALSCVVYPLGFDF